MNFLIFLTVGYCLIMAGISWNICVYTYQRKKHKIPFFIDWIEAHHNLYKINHRIEIKKIQKKRIEVIEVEEVKEIDRPTEWQVMYNDRLTDYKTKLIDK